MTIPLGDERIQFFLRHRDEIRTWAAIEPDVAAAVRDLLAATQADIEERLVALDPDVTTARRDNARWEHILARRPRWPDWVGVALEWETNVDPFGSALPKIGVLVLGDDPSLGAVRTRLVTLCKETGGLEALGYRVPAEAVWPVMRRVAKSRDWWLDPATYAGAIVETVVDLWPRVAPLLDRALEPSHGVA